MYYYYNDIAIKITNVYLNIFYHRLNNVISKCKLSKCIYIITMAPKKNTRAIFL